MVRSTRYITASIMSTTLIDYLVRSISAQFDILLAMSRVTSLGCHRNPFLFVELRHSRDSDSIVRILISIISPFDAGSLVTISLVILARIALILQLRAI